MKTSLFFIFFLLSKISAITPKPRQIPPKLCVNCKFFINDFFTNNSFGKCALFTQVEKRDNDFLVDGIKRNQKPDYYYCSTVREFNDMCGEEGKFFEKK